ncbi:MAG TPA: hypothetical protein VKT53_06045 [Candidatus Acidoferrum sp.]|nr:hypothetical protein [Candidatus Acidoferrum sp.]
MNATNASNLTPPLDRYLNNLAKLLPADQREDILHELRDDIQSEFDEKESELCRPLTEPEQLQVLKRRGNPLQVAAGYTRNQGTLAFGPQLIGPVLFPFYVRVLSFNLGLTLLIVGAIFAALSLSGQPIHFADLFSSVVLQIFIQLTAVTVIFALVEKHLARQPHEWSKEDFQNNLQAAIKSRIERNIQSGPKEVSRFDSIAILVASGVALLWLQSVWANQYLIFGPAAYLISLAPIWHTIYLPTIAIMLVTIVRAAINIARPDWVRFRDIVAVILDAASLAIIYALMFAHTWVVPAAAAAASSDTQHVASVVNQWVPYGLFACAVIAVAQAIHNLIRLYKNWRWHSSATRTSH